MLGEDPFFCSGYQTDSRPRKIDPASQCVRFLVLVPPERSLDALLRALGSNSATLFDHLIGADSRILKSWFDDGSEQISRLTKNQSSFRNSNRWPVGEFSHPISPRRE